MSTKRLFDTTAQVPYIITNGELADLRNGLSVPNAYLPKRQTGRVKAKKGKPDGNKK
jgi:hypothetical protein